MWIAVNAVQAVYFFHLGLWAQFGLQFILAGMSAYGWTQWRDEEARAKAPVSA